MPSLIMPEDAGVLLGQHLLPGGDWASRLVAGLADPDAETIELALRPGVDSSASVMRMSLAAWEDWRAAWRRSSIQDRDGAELIGREITIVGKSQAALRTLRITKLEAALAAARSLGYTRDLIDIARARTILARLNALSEKLSAPDLRAVERLPDSEVGMLFQALEWLADHRDLSGWTRRQAPIPGIDSKWLDRRAGLIGALTGRDLREELRPRLAVVHLTYVDPGYLASGGRRHDAWTEGDSHTPAYRPRIVIVVENRDCRLWFPETPGALVVEGEGKAAVTLASVPWLLEVDRIVYWGDIDSDGFAILNALRAELRQRGRGVESLLMDSVAYAHYRGLGVNHDRNGKPLQPSKASLGELTLAEAECYAAVATLGDAFVRRIEQERIPTEDVNRALERLLH